jgi:hypothetical protein
MVFCQATTKSPSPSIAMDGVELSPPAVAKNNVPPCGAPEALNRSARADG